MIGGVRDCSSSSFAPTTLTRATTDPMLRSIPPLTMIIVIPKAQLATITVCVKMILKFPPVFLPNAPALRAYRFA